MTAPKIAFVYLLNRMENAASAKEPFKAGFAEHRKAVVEHVNRIETELADARAALRDVFASDGSEGIYDAVKLYAARERARNLLAKQG